MPADTVTTAAIADGAVTPQKLDLTTYPVFYRESTTSYDVTSGTWSNTGTTTSISVPSWATEAVVVVKVSGAYQMNTSPSDSEFRVSIGSAIGTDFFHRNSGYANNVDGVSLVTLSGQGTQTMTLQARRAGGTGAVRLNASTFNGLVFFR